jgi:hypothetical protein
MTSTQSTFARDANAVPITGLGLVESKTITYVAGTTGAVATTTLFTVTGIVALNVYAICTSSLTGTTGTIEVGTATLTTALANQVTATTITNHKMYSNSTLAVAGSVAGHTHIVNENVIQTIATAAITGGVLTYFCGWIPLSSDGNVVAA